MHMFKLPSLVTPAWLSERLDHRSDLRILDASWYLPSEQRNPEEEYLQCHIPRAEYFNIDRCCDARSKLPHMLPDAETFAAYVGKLGIGAATAVVIYDCSGLQFSAARVWWMLRFFGHQRVALLDGGLPAWRQAGLPLTHKREKITTVSFTPHPDYQQLRTLTQMRANLNNPLEQVLDMRSSARFIGAETEPRPHTACGHIPGSFNIPYDDFSEHGFFRKTDALSTLFTAKGIDLQRPVVASCGSGVTACVGLFALHLLQHPRTALYDGSWSEWGMESLQNPIARG